jgi:hypothetical protein
MKECGICAGSLRGGKDMGTGLKVLALVAAGMVLAGCEIVQDEGVTVTQVTHRGQPARILEFKGSTTESGGSRNVFTTRYAEYKGKRLQCTLDSDCTAELDQLIALDIFNQEKKAATTTRIVPTQDEDEGGC